MSTRVHRRSPAVVGRSLILLSSLLLVLALCAWLFLSQQTPVYILSSASRPTKTIELGLLLQAAATPADGLYVLAVTEHGFAADAGVEPGDQLTAVNGTPLTTVSELDALLATLSPSDSLYASIRRDNADITLTLLSTP